MGKYKSALIKSTRWETYGNFKAIKAQFVSQIYILPLKTSVTPYNFVQIPLFDMLIKKVVWKFKFVWFKFNMILITSTEQVIESARSL